MLCYPQALAEWLAMALPRLDRSWPAAELCSRLAMRQRCATWLALTLLAAFAPLARGACDAVRTLPPDGSLYRGALEPGCAVALTVAPNSSQCANGSFLSVEVRAPGPPNVRGTLW